MNILHVIATLAPRDGGPSKACFEMARAVARRGHDVTIMTTNKDGAGTLDVLPGEVIVRDGVTLRHFPIAAPRFWGRSPALADALRTAIPAADVVHLHSLYLYHDLIAGRICQRTGVPYILRPHGTLDPYLWRHHRLRKTLVELAFQNRVTRGAARIHFTTQDEQVLAAPYTFGVPGLVIPNGLDPADYADLPPPGSFRAGHAQLGDGPLVLFFGRLNFKKGLDILSEAFAPVAARFPDARLVIAGPDDGMETKVRGWLADRGLADRALFTGMVTGRDVLAVLNDADLFVLPSYTENFGFAVIEALACGTPVAISDRVGVWREITAADAGWVTPAEAGPFAEAMIAALSDREALRVRGRNGRAMVAEQFAWPEIAASLERAYAEVASGAVTPRTAARPADIVAAGS